MSFLRSAVNVAPTSKVLATGVPIARGLNLAAASGAHAGHGHHDSSSRTDFSSVPSWATRVENGLQGTIARSKVNGEFASNSCKGRWLALDQWMREKGRFSIGFGRGRQLGVAGFARVQGARVMFCTFAARRSELARRLGLQDELQVTVEADQPDASPRWRCITSWCWRPLHGSAQSRRCF